MPSKFIYSDAIPAEILPLIQTKLEKYENMIPGWAQEVRVYWNGNPGGEAISGSSDGNFGYRWATVTLCPAFLEERDLDREDTIVHELSHVILFPLTNFYDQLMGYLDEQPDKVKDFMRQQLLERIEGVTVDLTTALFKLLRKDDADSTKEIGPKTPVKKKRTTGQKKK